MSDPRSERIAANEASYRDLNETIEAGTAGGRRFQLICECGEVDCTGALNIGREEYAAVRANPRRFIVLPGHEIPDTEDVVERQAGYFVVEKHENVAHIVDPGGRAP